MASRPLGHPPYTACHPTFVLKAESYCLEAHMYPWNKIHIDKRKKIHIDELNKELAHTELVTEHMLGCALTLDQCIDYWLWFKVLIGTVNDYKGKGTIENEEYLGINLFIVSCDGERVGT